MSTTSRSGSVVLELTSGLHVGDSRKIDRGLGFMPVHVECLRRSGRLALGRQLEPALLQHPEQPGLRG